jgi:hypothetical protein
MGRLEESVGLDMYLTGNKFFWTDWENEANNRKEDGFQIADLNLRLGYWRKHPNLHGYIVKTFAEGKDECQEIGLVRDDLLKIVQAVKDRDLPHTEGFFFSKSYGTDEEAAEDIAILERATAWLDVKGDRVSRSVVYRASW